MNLRLSSRPAQMGLARRRASRSRDPNCHPAPLPPHKHLTPRHPDMSDISLDVPIFFSRAKALLSAWKVSSLSPSSSFLPPGSRRRARLSARRSIPTRDISLWACSGIVSACGTSSSCSVDGRRRMGGWKALARAQIDVKLERG